MKPNSAAWKRITERWHWACQPSWPFNNHPQPTIHHYQGEAKSTWAIQDSGEIPSHTPLHIITSCYCHNHTIDQELTWQTPYQGSFMYQLVQKLKSSKKFCKEWCLQRRQERLEIWEKQCRKNESTLQELVQENLNPASLSQYCRYVERLHLNIQDLNTYRKQRSKLK